MSVCLKKVKVSYLTSVVYESPHLVWMEQIIFCRGNGACPSAMFFFEVLTFTDDAL